MTSEIKNNSINGLALALSKAQGEIKPPIKNRHVDFKDKNGRQVKYSYSDLSDLIAAAQAALTKHELAVSHRMLETEKGLVLITTLMHSSGEKLESVYPLPDATNIRPQEFGSALTYARRYSLSGLIGIASDEDDDGAAAVAPSKAAQQKQTKTTKDEQKQPEDIKAPASELSQDQLKRMFAIGKASGWSAEDIKSYMTKTFSIESTKQLTKYQYDKICEYMEKFPLGKSEAPTKAPEQKAEETTSSKQDKTTSGTSGLLPNNKVPAEYILMLPEPADETFKNLDYKALKECSVPELKQLRTYIVLETKRATPPKGMLRLLEIQKMIGKFLEETAGAK